MTSDFNFKTGFGFLCVARFMPTLFHLSTLKIAGWCSVNYPSLFLPPCLTVPAFRRLPAYSRVTVYRQGRCRRKMKYCLPSSNYRHVSYRQTELPSDLCLTAYRQINTGNCRYRRESTPNTGYRQKSRHWITPEEYRQHWIPPKTHRQ